MTSLGESSVVLCLTCAFFSLDIVQRVMRKDGDIPFRPKLAVLGAEPKFATDCIKDCWAEDPLARPDFKTIRNKLKPLQKGM